MAEHRDLELALHDLRGTIAFPAMPDLAAAVAGASAVRRSRRLAPRRRARRWRTRGRRGGSVRARPGVTVFALSPRASSAAADLFDVAGIDIRFGASDEPRRRWARTSASAGTSGWAGHGGGRLRRARARTRWATTGGLPARRRRVARIRRRAGDRVRGRIRRGLRGEGDRDAPRRSRTWRSSPGSTGYWFAGEPHRLLLQRRHDR